MLIFFWKGIRVLTSQNRRNFDIFWKNNKILYFATFHFWRVGRRCAHHTAHIAAHSHLVRTGFALNYLPPASVPSAHPQTHVLLFLFFEGPKGRYGPREAWAHMGWVGHPAH